MQKFASRNGLNWCECVLFILSPEVSWIHRCNTDYIEPQKALMSTETTKKSADHQKTPTDQWIAGSVSNQPRICQKKVHLQVCLKGFKHARFLSTGRSTPLPPYRVAFKAGNHVPQRTSTYNISKLRGIMTRAINMMNAEGHGRTNHKNV